MLKHTADHMNEVANRIQGLEEELKNLVHPDNEHLLFVNHNKGLTFSGGFANIKNRKLTEAQHELQNPSKGITSKAS